MSQTTAVFYQKSKIVQEEFKLIEMTTVREMHVSALDKIIGEVKMARRQLDQDTMLETFTLFNKVRRATMNLIYAISLWQETFTKPIRPKILEVDYIIERMIKHIDFINASPLRKLFNFQFFRGNVLLIPYPNLFSNVPVKVSTKLAVQIQYFAAPPEDELIRCYQFLVNCLPDNIFKQNVVSIQKWITEPWIPRIFVSDDLNTGPARTLAAFMDDEDLPGNVGKTTKTSKTNKTSKSRPVSGVAAGDKSGKMKKSSSSKVGVKLPAIGKPKGDTPDVKQKPVKAVTRMKKNRQKKDAKEEKENLDASMSEEEILEMERVANEEKIIRMRKKREQEEMQRIEAEFTSTKTKLVSQIFKSTATIKDPLITKDVDIITELQKRTTIKIEASRPKSPTRIPFVSVQEIKMDDMLLPVDDEGAAGANNDDDKGKKKRKGRKKKNAKKPATPNGGYYPSSAADQDENMEQGSQKLRGDEGKSVTHSGSDDEEDEGESSGGEDEDEEEEEEEGGNRDKGKNVGEKTKEVDPDLKKASNTATAAVSGDKEGNGLVRRMSDLTISFSVNEEVLNGDDNALNAKGAPSAATTGGKKKSGKSTTDMSPLRATRTRAAEGANINGLSPGGRSRPKSRGGGRGGGGGGGDGTAASVANSSVGGVDSITMGSDEPYTEDGSPYSRKRKPPSGKPAVLSLTTRRVKGWFAEELAIEKGNAITSTDPFM